MTIEDFDERNDALFPIIHKKFKHGKCPGDPNGSPNGRPVYWYVLLSANTRRHFVYFFLSAVLSF